MKSGPFGTWCTFNHLKSDVRILIPHYIKCMKIFGKTCILRVECSFLLWFLCNKYDIHKNKFFNQTLLHPNCFKYLNLNFNLVCYNNTTQHFKIKMFLNLKFHSQPVEKHFKIKIFCFEHLMIFLRMQKWRHTNLGFFDPSLICLAFMSLYHKINICVTSFLNVP